MDAADAPWFSPIHVLSMMPPYVTLPRVHQPPWGGEGMSVSPELPQDMVAKILPYFACPAQRQSLPSLKSSHLPGENRPRCPQPRERLPGKCSHEALPMLPSIPAHPRDKMVQRHPFVTPVTVIPSSIMQGMGWADWEGNLSPGGAPGQRVL